MNSKIEFQEICIPIDLLIVCFFMLVASWIVEETDRQRKTTSWIAGATVRLRHTLVGLLASYSFDIHLLYIQHTFGQHTSTCYLWTESVLGQRLSPT